MIIQIDSREKNPLNFPSYFYGVEKTVSTKLDVGDYNVLFKDLYVPPFAIERKEVGDLFSTLTSGYDRFRREIDRANESGVILVIAVEDTLTNVRRGHTYHKRDENGVMQECILQGEPRVKQLETIWAEHGINTHYFSSRSEMSYWIYRRFYAIGELYIKDKLGFKNASRKRIKELL